MPTLGCDSINEKILQHLSTLTSVEQMRDLCVATMPVRTLDGRLADVFIEKRMNDYYLVHDAGKAANELIINGMSITDSISENCKKLAERFGVKWDDETFQFSCKIEQLGATALAVATCSALAMVYLLDHVAKTDQESIHDQIGSALKAWGKKRARIRQRVQADGKLKQHSFDFVVYPKAVQQKQPIAISVLNPSGGAISAAERFGFKIQDLEKTAFSKWEMVAIETRSENWTRPARELVSKCAKVISFRSGEKPTSEGIANSLNDLWSGSLAS